MTSKYDPKFHAQVAARLEALVIRIPSDEAVFPTLAETVLDLFYAGKNEGCQPSLN